MGEAKSATKKPPTGGYAPFSKEELQLAFLKCGITAADFQDILPCNKATLYTFLKTGESRRLNVFAFERIYAMMCDGLDAKKFPLTGGMKSKDRRNAVKSLFETWQFSGQGFKA